MLDFRGLIATLESRGELQRIRKRVEPRFEDESRDHAKGPML